MSGMTYQEAYERYCTPITNYIHNQISNREQAEDLAQEVFLKLWKYWEQIEPHARSAWLYQVAKRQCIDVLRKRKLILMVALSDDLIGSLLDDSPIDQSDERIVLSSVCAQINAKNLQALLMLNNGYCIREIAECMGATESAVKMKILRAKDALIERLKEVA